MNTIIDTLKQQDGLMSFGPVSADEIREVETKLQTQFAEDYREYVHEFGAASFVGHEFTGICHSKSLNVYHVTIEAREINPSVPSGWYVIEEAHIDGILIWQATDGSVWQTAPGAHAKKIADSMAMYIEP